MPVLATYFIVRRGRDPFFKFYMRTLFPRQAREYEQRYGLRFLGWYNVAHGSEYDNVILIDLPDYATLDRLEAKGYVTSSVGEPTAERGGRGRRLFRVTASGRRVLRRSLAAITRMSEGLHELLEPQ